MKLNITAELNGKEIADNLIHDIQTNHGIVVNNGIVKCIVTKKDGAEVEIDLDKVKFVFTRE